MGSCSRARVRSSVESVELVELAAAFDAAELGEHVLVLVAGEPGIGKTRLVNEATSRVSARVLRAACWPDDDAPAFWPWRQVLRPLGGPDLWADHSGGSSGGDARFWLFDTVAEQLAIESHDRPLVLVIDDLHWADEASIRLLRFLIQDTRDRRLAIVGTYRDTDLGPDHPLARCLDELIREGLHLSLGGLSHGQVAELVGALTGDAGPAADLVARVHRRSGGNPLLVRELVRLLETQDPAGAADTDAPGTLPAGVRRRSLGGCGPCRRTCTRSCSPPR